MYIQPNSSIIVYKNVPLDNSYMQTIRPETVAERNQWLAHYSPMSFTSYTYLRENNSIRVDATTTNMLGVNYLAYRNINYENKYYYYFITDIVYINDHTCELILEEDVISTWWEEKIFLPSFIEREHTAVDRIGNNLQTEPVDFGQLVCTKIVDLGKVNTQGYKFIFVCNEVLNYPGVATLLPQTVASEYRGLYSNIPIYSVNSAAGLSGIIIDLIEDNKQESIGPIYAYPSYFIDNASVDVTLNIPDTIDGYTPHNNKLFTYPFSVECIDTLNDTKEYHREYFEHVDTCKLRLSSSVVGSPEIICTPLDYNGSYVGENVQTPNPFETVICSDFAEGTATIDFLTSWNARNRSAAILDVASSAISAGVGFASGNAVKGTMGIVGAASSINSAVIASSKGTKTRTTKSGNAETAIKIKSIYYKHITMNNQQARSVDQYFDRYGYAINQVAVPNIYSRPRWNYVKTVDAQIGGNLPQSARLKISDILNNGIAFWNTETPYDKFGDYTEGLFNEAPVR